MKKLMNAHEALAYVREHGIVLASARGPVPTLTHAIAGEAIDGSWWSHPKGRHIFAVLGEVSDSDQILVCRLVDDKITLVQQRLWPALVAAAACFPASRLCRVAQVHTAGGRHENRETAFPAWVPADVAAKAGALDPGAALAALGAWARP